MPVKSPNIGASVKPHASVMAYRHDSGDVKALWSQSLYIPGIHYWYCCTLHIIVYTIQKDIQYNKKNRKIFTSGGKGGVGGRRRERLVTGVRSGWGRTSRSMRIKNHICQPVVVRVGRVSVSTDALLGEASRDARACVTSTVDLQRHYC